MFYYLYEIKNNLNGKIYVGVHKTKDMEDGYMGSGKVIRSAIEKYGIENFTKVILETFDDSENMYIREAEVVTDEFLLREDVYNLRRGGFGGFDHINKNGLNDRTGATLTDKQKDNISQGVKSTITPDRLKEMSDRMLGNEYNPLFRLTGKAHPASGQKTKEHIDKIRNGILSSPSLGQNGKLNKGKPKQKIECPHCHKIGGINMMKRWHFENCRNSGS
jgi:hypothetical protein